MKAAVTSSFELGSGRGEASGCVAGVLHWMLCRNLRDRRFTDEEGEVVGSRREEQGNKSEAVAATAASSSPGIVARLMGLESSPAFPHAQPGKITRTRSANSAEPWKGPVLPAEPTGGNGGSELRKSQSFREVRSYLRKESEEFLVLSFGDDDDDDESGALELNTKKLDDGFEQSGLKENRGERKLAEKKRSRNKSLLVNSAEIKQSDVKSSVSAETAERSSSCRKKISFGHEEMQLDCSSQNSSPVSVLDLPLDADGDCLTSPDSSISVCEVSVLKSEEEEDSRKKVSLEVEDESRKAGECGGVATQNFSDIWALICSLGEDDLNNAKWFKARMVKSEEAEEIGFVVWQDVFELLLNEALFDMFH